MSRTTAPRLSLRLRPLGGATRTELVLSGPIYSVPPTTELRSLFRLLWQWHGGFVDVALCVDGTNGVACWADLWGHRLASAPAHHLRVGLVVHGDTLARDDDGDL